MTPFLAYVGYGGRALFRRQALTSFMARLSSPKPEPVEQAERDEFGGLSPWSRNVARVIFVHAERWLGRGSAVRAHAKVACCVKKAEKTARFLIESCVFRAKSGCFLRDFNR
jgi:hypothetical protein